MSQSTTNIFYVVTQQIEKRKHYYSHWERLHPESKVYGVVWNEYLAYCYFFETNRAAKDMKKRIEEFDKKLKCEIIQVGKTDIGLSMQELAALKMPAPIKHFNEWYLVPDKNTILPFTKNS